MDLDKVINSFFAVIKENVENITLPVGNTLVSSLKYAIVIFCVSLVFKLLDIYVFIHPLGALLAIIVFIVLSTSFDFVISQL